MYTSTSTSFSIPILPSKFSVKFDGKNGQKNGQKNDPKNDQKYKKCHFLKNSIFKFNINLSIPKIGGINIGK